MMVVLAELRLYAKEITSLALEGILNQGQLQPVAENDLMGKAVAAPQR